MTELTATLKEFLTIVQALGPWGVVFFLWWEGKKEQKKWEERFEAESKKWDDRHQAVVRMYENNVELAKSNEAFANGYQDIIIFNTQVLTQVKERIDSNMFCPMSDRRNKNWRVKDEQA